MRKLFEGLRGGDLEDLVLPLLSVDEYESKIDPTAVVIAFYVNEQSAAEDLNRFIQRSPIELIDTEISPAPDQQGYYMVFVEMLNNSQFVSNVQGILDEVAPLAYVNDWKLQIRGNDDLVPFSEEVLENARKAAREDAENASKDEDEKVAESIMRYLTPSMLSNANIYGDKIIIEGGRDQFSFQVIGFGDPSHILSETKLNEMPVSLSLPDVSKCARITAILGEGWSVQKIGDCDVLQRHDSDAVLVLK